MNRSEELALRLELSQARRDIADLKQLLDAATRQLHETGAQSFRIPQPVQTSADSGD